MKIVFIIFMFVIMAYADTNKIDVYLIEPEQIYEIEQKINPKMGNTLILSIKPKFWHSLFDYTLRHLNKKAKIQIEDITINPYIAEPIFHKIQLLLPESYILSQEFNSNISTIIDIKNREILRLEDKLKKEK